MRCPHCKTPITAGMRRDWLPFCSRRCQLIDLGNWLSEKHRIPSEEPEDFTAPPADPDEHQH